MRDLRGLLVNDASLAGHHGSALVSAQAVKLASAAGIRLVAGWDWRSAEAVLSGRHDFDLVVVNGEGSIHHDSRTAQRIAALAQSLQARGVPAYLINASVEANSQGIYDGLAAFRLKYVRDTMSSETLAGAGVDAVVVPDLTLSWQEAPVASGGHGLIVTDASDARKAALLLGLARRWGAQPVTMRTVPPWPSRGRGTRRAAFELKRLVGRLAPTSSRSWRYTGALRSLSELTATLVGANAAVCGRYHAVCLALRLGLPFLAVEGNIGKVRGLLADIGLVGRITSLEALRNQAVPPVISPFTEAEQAAIDAFLGEAAQGAKRMFEEIGREARRT